jgi:glycosyltransferase involved in cell wall biosynthesis
MRVLHLTNAGGFGRVQFGGAERAVEELANYLAARKGWDCHVAGPHAFIDSAAFAEGVTTWPIGLTAFSLSTGFNPRGPVAAVIRAVRPKTIVTHLLRATLIGQPIAAALRVPNRVSNLHNSLHDSMAASQSSAARDMCYSLGFAGVSRLFTHTTIAISAPNATDLHTRSRIPWHSIALIHNWVSREFDYTSTLAARRRARQRLGIADATPVVQVAGRLEPQKRQDFLIELITDSRLSDVHLVLLGEGSLAADYRVLVDRLGLAERVRFLGFHRDVPSYMSIADLVAVPSAFEGFGRIAAEALALGIPVVANRVGGLVDVLQDAPCAVTRLVEPFHREGWVQAIRGILDRSASPLPVEALGLYARRFSLERAAEQYAAVLCSTDDG